MNQFNRFKFIFIHGYGTSKLDFSTLPEELEKRGHIVEFISLPGHEGFNEKFDNPNISEYKAAVEDCLTKCRDENETVVLIGSSLGATLALDVAKQSNAVGVVGLSTFLGLPFQKRWALSIVKKLTGRSRFPRQLAVTKPSQASALRASTYIPIVGAQRVEKYGRSLRCSEYRTKGTVLLIHSFDDTVASYMDVARFAQSTSGDIELIGLNGLGHYIAHDIDCGQLATLIEARFGIQSTPDSEVTSFLDEQYKQLNEEHRFWALRIFQLVIAFFTIFGLLLSNSLESVLTNSAGSYYFLLSYTTIPSIYVCMAALYYFFLVRTQAYIAQFIEPYYPSLGFQQYKINSNISGSLSARMSSTVSLILFFIPLFISFYGLFEFVVLHNVRLAPDRENSLVLVWFTLNVLLLFASVNAVSKVFLYGRRQLYGIILGPSRSPSLSKVYTDFFRGVR